MLAWRLGDEEQARRFLTAVKHAGRPTSNIATTITYRGLPQFISIEAERPTDLDLSAEFEDARNWLRELCSASNDTIATTADIAALATPSHEAP